MTRFSPTSPKEIEHQSKRVAEGRAPAHLADKVRPGAVFLVEDTAINFPEDELGGERTLHPKRRVILVDRLEEAREDDPLTISVVPCTASRTDSATVYELDIPAEETAFTKPNIVALVHLIQPILKSKLHKWVGDLTPQGWVCLQAKIAQKFSLLDESDASQRISHARAILASRYGSVEEEEQESGSEGG